MQGYCRIKDGRRTPSCAKRVLDIADLQTSAFKTLSLVEPPTYVHSVMPQKDWQASKIPRQTLPDDLYYMIHGVKLTVDDR